uniref:hypothetical protein n=1 Tax=Winogradskyella sp. TaxID=1883156 RepID=UPI0025DE1BCA
MIKKYTFIIIFCLSLFFINKGVSQVSYTGNSNSGFGGPIGGASMTVDDNGTAVTFTFTKGGGGFNDTMVMYISNGETGRTFIGSDVNDTADSNRRAISNTGSSNLNFPTGFEATHGIAINTGFGGLWGIPVTGPVGSNGLNFITGVGAPASSATTSFTFSFDWSQIGLTDCDKFDFVVTYGNPNDGGSNMFSSDEAFGGGIGSGNPGLGGMTFTSHSSYPNTWTGTTSTNFNIGSNWSEGLPNGNHTLFIPNTTNQPISISVITIKRIVVDSGSSLTAENSLTANVILKSTSTSYSSLIVDGSVTGTVRYNRHINNNAPVNGNDLISAPLSGEAFDTFITNNPNILANPSGSEVLFGGFDNNSSTNPFELWDETDTTPLVAGKGYRSGITVGASSNLITFEGIVNTSLVEIAINQGTESKLNLIGNPFPSYLDAQLFLTQNASLLDPSASVIYGYNDSTDGTSAGDYTIISALLNNTLNIAPGQAFFVASDIAPVGDVEFTTSGPDMRLAAGGDDFIAGRNTSAITNLKLNLSTATDNFITDIFFTESSSLGLDPSYDASLLGGIAPAFALYSHLVQDNADVPMAIQALGETDYSDVTIPLGVNANQGEQLTFNITANTLPN